MGLLHRDLSRQLLRQAGVSPAQQARCGRSSQVATEKAKAAQDEQTRLAIEGAKKAEQAKAAAQAKAAEHARVVAEQTAEDARLESERAKAIAKAKSAEVAKAAAKDTSKEASKEEAKVAALTPAQFAPKPDAPVIVADISKHLQIELRRVGCNISATSDVWTPAAQKAMALFNKSAGMTLVVKVASADSLDAVKRKQGRICRLICEHGYKANGDLCTKISCRSGYQVGDDNSCEKVEARKKPAPPVAKREHAKPPKAAETKSSGSGQIICPLNGHSRPVAKGCRIATGSDTRTLGSGQVEICN